MKPKTQQKHKSRILLGNCLDMLRQYPDKSIDLILTDPPYNAKNIGRHEKKYSLGLMSLPEEQYQKFCNDWFKEASRVAKTVVFTPGITNITRYPQPDWVICWHKPAAYGFNRFGGFNAWEPVFVYGKIAKGKRLPQDYIMTHSLFFSKGPEINHPCPKPPVLMKFLIDKFCPENGVVLDPFNGSGTTTVAAKHLGRDFIGIDINPEYNQIAEERLRQEVLL